MINRKTAVVYARAQGAEDNVTISLSQQQAECRARLEADGYEVVAVFDDDCSGNIAKPAGFVRMLEFLDANRDVTVMSVDPARIARGFRLYQDKLKALEARSAHLTFARLGGAPDRSPQKMGNRDELVEAYVYARVSSIKQTVEGDGLRSQETVCRNYALTRGYQVVGVFSDDMTGKVEHRPGIKKMLAEIRRRKRRATRIVVIIDDISRLARNVRTHHALREQIEQAGAILESPTLAFGSDPGKRLVENMMASVSQYHTDNNADVTKRRIIARLESGYWVFQAPVGYEYYGVRGRGRMLRLKEPVASIVRQALEGYAAGALETQADVLRFLDGNPLFPRPSGERVRHHRVLQLLSNVVYAGYVWSVDWGVSMRPGVHEPLITLDTYRRIQDRLHGKGYAPRQRNLNEDFPLRGFVKCADCGTPLTACWSKGKTRKHPCYLCPKRGCASYGKSTKRADLEGQFETMLRSIEPSRALFEVASEMFRDLWDMRDRQIEDEKKELVATIAKLER